MLAWGSSASGQLGNSNESPSIVPLLVQGLSSIGNIGVGDLTSLAIYSIFFILFNAFFFSENGRLEV